MVVLKRRGDKIDTTEQSGKIQNNEIAKKRNQSLAQMALAWVMRNKNITSVLIGASSPEQIKENVEVMHNISFTETEPRSIDAILAG